MVNSILLFLVLSGLAHAGCTAPSCPAAVVGCSSNPGCYVNYAQTPRCSEPEVGCYDKSQSSCTATPSCEWRAGSGGYCTSDGSCSGLTENACTSAGCYWYVPSSSGSCYTKSCNYGKSECASNGCKWKSDFCGGPEGHSCDVLSEEKCVKGTTGCVWNGYYCNVANDLNCVDNSTHTGCDVSSDAGCWWQSGYCRSDSEATCSSIDNKAACDSDPSKSCEWTPSSSSPYCSSSPCMSSSTGCDASNPGYCHWEANTGECRDKNFYCQTKLDGTGCTESSDTECIFKPATTESCGADEDLASFCPLDGDSCSADSLEEGCVDSSAFIVRVSLRLAFVAVLSFLFL